MTTTPDFADWPTSRLEFLLDEYHIALTSLRTHHGSRVEALLYQTWIQAIETELNKRP
jgi:hypothetical protein